MKRSVLATLLAVFPFFAQASNKVIPLWIEIRPTQDSGGNVWIPIKNTITLTGYRFTFSISSFPPYVNAFTTSEAYAEVTTAPPTFSTNGLFEVGGPFISNIDVGPPQRNGPNINNNSAMSSQTLGDIWRSALNLSNASQTEAEIVSPSGWSLTIPAGDYLVVHADSGVYNNSGANIIVDVNGDFYYQ
jgi:hypothetical protein